MILLSRRLSGEPSTLPPKKRRDVLPAELWISTKRKAPDFSEALSDPAGIRTQDPYIKSVLLYQLSYGIVFLVPVSTIALVF